MMKNYFIIALLFAGFLSADKLQAQDTGPKAGKKEYKMYKKESKIGRKMWRDKEGKAHRKKHKARKKAYKMEMKDEMEK